jgi:DNA-binding Lrp family transcriptional regulator
VRSYVLIETMVGRADDVARETSRIEGVEHVDVVTGCYDVVVEAEMPTRAELEDLVDRVRLIESVTRALPCSSSPHAGAGREAAFAWSAA